VEYKYIVRAATSGEVVEWQPCDNLELALPEELVEAAEAPEGEPLVVVQDSWEGEQHSVKVREGVEGSLDQTQPFIQRRGRVNESSTLHMQRRGEAWGTTMYIETAAWTPCQPPAG
jgi:hypothetical protein